VTLPEDPQRELVLRGELIADGDTLLSRDLVAELGGQSLPLDLRVKGLRGTPRWTLRGVLEGADANALASAWAGTPDTLFGTLYFDAELAAPAGGDRALLDALTGKLALRIEPGRLRGVSLLRTAIDSIGPLAEAALLAGQLRGGSTLQRFFDDEFTSLTATFQVRDGRARTRDLQLVYRLYQINLQGDLGLADGALDLTGTLTMFEDEDSGGAPVRKIRRVLPLAAVRGTFRKPRVAIEAVPTRGGDRSSPR
jgi:AsmA protein